jgi:hypothetical protein
MAPFVCGSDAEARPDAVPNALCEWRNDFDRIDRKATRAVEHFKYGLLSSKEIRQDFLDWASIDRLEIRRSGEANFGGGSRVQKRMCPQKSMR